MYLIQVRKILNNLNTTSLKNQLDSFYQELSSEEKLGSNDGILLEIALYIKQLVMNEYISSEMKEKIIDELIIFIDKYNLYLFSSVMMLDNILFEYYNSNDRMYKHIINSLVKGVEVNELLQLSLEEHLYKMYTSPKHSSVKKLSLIIEYLSKECRYKLLGEALLRDCKQIIYFIFINTSLINNISLSMYEDECVKSSTIRKDTNYSIKLVIKLDEYIYQFNNVKKDITSIMYGDIWYIMSEYIFGPRAKSQE